MVANGGFANGPFAFDFDDAYTGSASYVLSGTWNGVSVTAAFSPALNKQGVFEGFLGNNSAGTESDAPVGPVVVADITTAAPLPSTAWAGAGILALLACGKFAQSRRARRVA
jgi:hypothetical protein